MDNAVTLNDPGTPLCLHRDSLTRGEFETLKTCDPVHCVEAAGDNGPVATKMRPA